MHRMLSVILLGIALLPSVSRSESQPGTPTVDYGNFLDMEGNRHTLSTVISSGKNVVLVFWQTWCASCLGEMPELVKAAESYKAHFQYYGIISGPDEDVDEKKITKTIQKFKIPFPQIRDRELLITNHFAVKGTPTLIILGKGESTLYRGHGLPKEWQRFFP